MEDQPCILFPPLPLLLLSLSSTSPLIPSFTDTHTHTHAQRVPVWALGSNYLPNLCTDDTASKATQHTYMDVFKHSMYVHQVQPSPLDGARISKGRWAEAARKQTTSRQSAKTA